MDVGIAKIGKKVFFHDNKEDYAAWSEEVVKTYQIFKDFGHNVDILTDSDLRDDEKRPLLIRYDRIYVFNGPVQSGSFSGIRPITASGFCKRRRC